MTEQPIEYNKHAGQLLAALAQPGAVGGQTKLTIVAHLSPVVDTSQGTLRSNEATEHQKRYDFVGAQLYWSVTTRGRKLPTIATTFVI